MIPSEAFAASEMRLRALERCLVNAPGSLHCLDAECPLKVQLPVRQIL